MSGSRLVCITLLATIFAFAQDHNVTLNVVVTNSSNAPVTSLQKQDFTVLDNKRPQAITSFESPSSDQNTQVVIVLDAVNIGFTRLAFAREQLDKFLRSENGRLAHPVSLAIFTDSGFGIQPESSQDGNALADYLDKSNIGLRSNTRSQGFYGASDRSQMSIRALQELADFESKRPGRKVVVWISPGWPLLTGPRIEISHKQALDIFNTIVKLSADLERAGVTLYSVDPLGTTQGIGSEFYWEQFTKPITAPNQVQLGNLALQVFAVHSGGRVLLANNDVAALIEQAVRNAGESYRLTYEAPEPGDKPNEFHAIEIKLDQPHLKAYTINGYYARPQQINPKSH